MLAMAGMLVAGCAAACTVLSGWSDLQDGPAPSRDAGGGGELDAGTAGSDGGGGGTAVLCAAHHCSAGQGCCAYYDGGGKCSSSTACDPGTALWVACTERRDCDGGVGAVCCLRSESGIARCAAACAAGELQLCAPRDDQACPSGTTCGSIGAPPALSVCQP